MAAETTHIIHRQSVRVKAGSVPGGMDVQQRLSRLLQEELPAKMEELFNRIAPAGKIVRLERLELDLGTISGDAIEREFEQRLLTALERAVEEKLLGSAGRAASVLVEPAESLYSAFVYFLQWGRLPWYRVPVSWVEWETAIMGQFGAGDWIRLFHWVCREAGVRPVVLERLALQTSPALRTTMLAAVGAVELTAIESRYARMIGGKEEVIMARGDASVDDSALREREQSPGLEASDREVEEEAVFTDNCGLVLLHPFLEHFFDGLGLLEGKAFRGVEEQRRAVLLLNYLATGACKAGEYELVLLKLLCGYPLEETLESEIVLTDREREESAEMLGAVLRHWAPLNRTSVDGLRAEFLQRPGKIRRRDKSWLVTIEQRAIDILLTKLPWGYATIRLPWMETMISVEWFG